MDRQSNIQIWMAVDYAWAAGFFDGEGYVSITRRDDTIHVRVSQVEREPLERLKDMFGGHIRDKRTTGNRKQCFEWNICTLAVLDFFKAIERYVVRSLMHSRIRVAREFFAAKSDHSVPEEERRRRMDALADAMTELNRRGQTNTPCGVDDASDSEQHRADEPQG